MTSVAPIVISSPQASDQSKSKSLVSEIRNILNDAQEDEHKVQQVQEVQENDEVPLNLSIYQLEKRFQESESSVIDKNIQISAFIKRVRSGDNGEIAFIDVQDGGMVGALMTLATREGYQGLEFKDHEDNKFYTTLTFEQLFDIKELSPSCSVLIDGKLVKSPLKATQNYELQIHRLQRIGNVEDPLTFPINRTSEKKLMSLRHHPFLRPRAPICQSLFRIRSSLELIIHQFFDQHNVVKMDPNIITASDCEGAGEVFTITPSFFSKNQKGDFIPVGLTVSSQLPLEAFAAGLRAVYTCQKSFRAEKSITTKHLAEFLHIEYEEYFISLDQLLDFTENFVKHIITEVYKKREDDFEYIENKFAPKDISPTRKMLMGLLDKPFVRIKHREAVEIIQKDLKDKVKVLDPKSNKMKRFKVQVYPTFDADLHAEHENYLVQKFGTFVFVTHWPLSIKSFYMKQCDDGSGECESFDLLAPLVGEMFGGSMREWRFDKLDAEIKKRGMNVEPIEWYLNLRKMGSAPHGGWGMGFARLMMLLTGVPSVRDIVPLPVAYNHCPY